MLSFPKGALTHHRQGRRCTAYGRRALYEVMCRRDAPISLQSLHKKGTSSMSNAQWEYENQDFLKARYEDKKWYTVRKHVCLECGKEYYTICNFRKYCSDACCAEAERKRTEERKSAHHSEHICKVCGKSFYSKRTDAQYCSNKCRQKSYRAEKR